MTPPRTPARGRARLRVAIAAMLIGVLASAGCGGEEDAPPPSAEQLAKTEAAKVARKKAKDDKAKAAKTKGRKSEEISFIPTLEKVVPDDERKKIRRKLKERDFAVDFTGTENRDPFRSYLLPQITGAAPTMNSTTGQPTERCTKSQLVAPSHALRDLSLIGIVRRGAQRFALFRDTGGVGRMVARGNCLGREKAKVTEIGESLVTIEIMPEVPPDAAIVPPPEKKSIALYPNELSLDSFEDEPTEEPSSGSTPSLAPAPPPAPPSTMLPGPEMTPDGT